MPEKRIQFSSNRMLHELKFVDGYKVHQRTNLYIDMGPACNGNCKFCIAQIKDRKADRTIIDNQLETLGQIDNMYYSVEFLGGEPLLYIENIKRMLQLIPKSKKKILVTNGIRKEFLSNITLLENFDYIDISKHHYDDDMNKKIMHSERDLLTLNDLRILPKKIKSKIRFNVTCFKDGLNNFNDIKLFVDTLSAVGYHNFMFANLTSLPDNSLYIDELVKFTENNRISDKTFTDISDKFVNTGSKNIKTIIGYAHYADIIKYSTNTLVFKTNDETMSRKVLSELLDHNVIFELVITPNGSLFADWQRANRLI